MPNNPLDNDELYDYGVNRSLTPPNEVVGIGSPPYFPQGYIFATPHDQDGPTGWRTFHTDYITDGIIDPNRLGTGYVGDGNRYLADNGTWKEITVTGGGTGTNSNVLIDGGSFAAPNNALIDAGSFT